jgi:MFS family permease
MRSKLPEDVSPTKTRHWVLVLTLALTAVSYLDRVCISMTAPFIQINLHLNDNQLWIVFGAFTFAYAALEMPAGWLADRFGPRLMLTRVVVWWSIMSALTGWVVGFASLLAIRFLFGVGEAWIFPGISHVYLRWLQVRAHG